MRMKSIRLLGLICVLTVNGTAHARSHHHSKPANHAGVFDYYALSMSWAPNFCASHTDPNECNTGKKFGFVLHGLWPQYTNGYPQSCSTQPLPADLKSQYAPMFASPDLINHEWPKHGTCSGLAPAEYLSLTKNLKDGLAIPSAYQQPEQPVRVTKADFFQAFKQANPTLADSSVLPFCNGSGRFLQEIHACYDKSGTSQSCSASEIKRSQTSCGQASFLLQSVR